MSIFYSITLYIITIALLFRYIKGNTVKLHLDLDCYFVSAERTRHPFLKGKNVVVAKSSDNKIFSKSKKQGVLLGDTGAFNSVFEFSNNYNQHNIIDAYKDEFISDDGKIHGIVIAKSYECKPYGIKTGTPLQEALFRCKDLIIIPSDHLFYQQLSQQLKSYLQMQIPALEQYSIDEFFGDVGGWIKDGDVLEFITNLRDEILKKFDLPITIAASESKWIAKLLTDKIKPFGVKVLPKEDVLEYTNNIDVNEFAGIGRAISKKLDNYKIKTLGELRQTPCILNQYGKTGKDLYKRICGIDNEKVIAYHDRRGIGISRNFKAIDDRVEVQRRTAILARYLSYQIIKLNLNPTTFYFKIKYEDGTKNSESITIDRLFSERLLIDLARSMLKKLDFHLGYKIHYIAISASNFSDSHNQKTLSLLDFNTDIKQKQLTDKLTLIRDKYGVDAIWWGSEG